MKKSLPFLWSVQSYLQSEMFYQIPLTWWKTYRCPLPKTWKHNLKIYILRIGHEGFLYNLYEIPKGNLHGYASNQSKCKKKMLLNLLRDFQTWLAFAKFHGVWFVCLPFPQRITKVVFCPQNMQNLPHIMTRRIWTLIKIFWRIPFS